MQPPCRPRVVYRGGLWRVQCPHVGLGEVWFQTHHMAMSWARRHAYRTAGRP